LLKKKKIQKKKRKKKDTGEPSFIAAMNISFMASPSLGSCMTGYGDFARSTICAQLSGKNNNNNNESDIIWQQSPHCSS
jgi:hypothetical protein